MNRLVSPMRPAAGCYSRCLLSGMWFCMVLLVSSPLAAQQPHWIWSPEHQAGNVPAGECYFRKVFNMREPERGEIAIACDDEYELFVNGRRVGRGGGWQEADPYDISRFLNRGRNAVAVKVVNNEGSTAGLVARLTVTERGGTSMVHSTDGSWKVNGRALIFWQQPGYSDRRWNTASVIGPVDTTAPWIDPAVAEADNAGGNSRFELDPEFQIQQVLTDEDSGSLLALAFNEFGQIIASQEEGPLLRIVDADGDAIPDTVQTYCELVTSCQGILPLNGKVFVVGQGSEGQAVYRLSDEDNDGLLEKAVALVKFTGEPGEHGPHGLTLGPDGFIYIVLGNHMTLDGQYASTSPYRHYYEGDLVRPRYEDPGGHARGIKTPAGTILRFDLEGRHVEMVAGGLRNCYDLAFTTEGELLTQDSDMEWDTGTSWYRPTRVLQVPAGAEFGWRSGCAKWPEYYLDSVPSVLDTGRGSPAGMVVYDHFMFPERYHNALFVCDWSMGRILAVKLEHQGAGYTASSEVFLQGRPLNVTDIEVGPDGWLYICTGGRGTQGGIFRIGWRGSVPDEIRNTGEGITAAIRQPQFNSAWARQRVAEIRQELGEDWEPQISGVARSTANPDEYRLRALDLMQLAGPLPSPSLLIELSHDESTAVRAKATVLMGLQADDDIRSRLVELLSDEEAYVRRLACEALVRAEATTSCETLEPLLASDDRWEAWAARRLLETFPAEEWEDDVLESEDLRVFLTGSTALMAAAPNRQRALEVLDRCGERMQGFVSDSDFLDLLRVTQLAMIRGEIEAGDAPRLTAQLTEEFPSGDPIMNRELIRLLMHLQVSSILDRYLAHLNDDIDDVEKVHLAVHLRYLREGWTTEQKIELLEFYEQSLALEGGKSFPRYVQNVSRDFASILTNDERRQIIARGQELPNAALSSLFALAANPSDDVLEMLLDLDRTIASETGEVFERLRMGCTAVLSLHGDEEAIEYLHEVFDQQPDRRETIAMGLSQHPEENWEYLVRALPVLKESSAQEVLRQLANVDRHPEEPEPYRQVILLGLADDENLAAGCNKLLAHWADESPTDAEDSEAKDTAEQLADWQNWFAETWPDELPATLPADREDAPWDYIELLEYLAGELPSEDAAAHGALVFREAKCASCHRYGDEGESLGPDLTDLRRRYTEGEILQSILYPSHVISTQYASKTVVTLQGRQYTGLVGSGESGKIVILQSDGTKVEVNEDDVDEILPSRLSSMPEGLLDELTLEQIADLFSFLSTDPGAAVTVRPVIEAAR